ncbi:helix-turn-helix transcriptional regulator [Rhizobium laguerreae]|nr:helix-turn-helix transcriptional regulator [Rhizobium laguerreae]MBY3448983.1 helix-turn-helix transcriptional regulator [Rhizobium laguerreae]MBY3456757.1 helix-turn-helix transcriptional regulator [Rhizobium laguerreae]
MNANQFRKARASLGLSAAQIASILNVDPRTIRKWESDDGTRPPNPIAVRVVEWMIGGYRPPQWPRDRIGRDDEEMQ